MMSHCKHTGCTAESLDDSVYCGRHQLATGKVRQRTTRGGDEPSRSGNDPADGGDANNPGNRGGQDDRGPMRGGN